ncbi:MAG: ligase-associated DNA damage response DEXH box helicase [Alphaproteobacteria bacterium]|nr:ligase-associated DNA damage response DEXH box helicase [Alphaproteobacteria bacterium]
MPSLAPAEPRLILGFMAERAVPTPAATLPEPIADWFAGRGWQPFAHQLDMLAAVEAGHNALLIAPTGGGKTLAGFLPTLGELIAAPRAGLHTLYISPLKALAVDIHRNLTLPVEEMGLDVTLETRTGDTPQSKRQRQRRRPPNILMTTPESLALMLSYAEAPRMFGNLRQVVLDELHALIGTKRGDLLALGLARLAALAPDCRRIGLSATVAWPDSVTAFLSPHGRADDPAVAVIEGQAGAEPRIETLVADDRLPWSGHMAAYAAPDIYARIKAARTAIVFVNTRAQAEIMFQALWRLNEDTLPIALHHGSLSAPQRRKVEAAMARGDLRAVVATSSLDLGIDWGDVDLVLQVGAPKGASRLLQRIGRANHRLDEPSRAILVPGNRFEVLECQAATAAVANHELDGDPPRPGGLDVLAQHVWGRACAGPFRPDDLYAEIVRASPYASLSRKDFDDVLDFVDHGGYALRTYDRYRRLIRQDDGTYRIAGPAHVRKYRLNVGVIVEAPTLRVKLKRGRVLGQVEEHFIMGLVPGDTFFFSGELLRFEGIRETTAEVTRAAGGEPQIPAYMGGRLPLSTHLADRVRANLHDRRQWRDLPPAVHEWLDLQRLRSELPRPDGLLVETFPRGGKHFLVAYCFEGRNAHQTLGMLLTRRMERSGAGPLGFVASDYAISVWSLRPPGDVAALFDEDMLGDDLEEWMDESTMLKRTFRNCAVIAGLIERRHPNQEMTRRQVTFNADIIYDVLRRHEPDHVLLRATRGDAAGGLTDIARLGQLLARTRGRIRHRELDRVSPLAVPVLLDIGREGVYGSALDDLLDEGARALIEDAIGPTQDRLL